MVLQSQKPLGNENTRNVVLIILNNYVPRPRVSPQTLSEPKAAEKKNPALGTNHIARYVHSTCSHTDKKGIKHDVN